MSTSRLLWRVRCRMHVDEISAAGEVTQGFESAKDVELAFPCSLVYHLNGRTGRALVHVVLRRRAIAPRFLPPISVVFAGARDRYIGGLTSFRGEGVTAWIEDFVTAADRAARLARAYVAAVRSLQEQWRVQLRATENAPRADAAAWAIINVLPAHPMISGPVAAAVIGRAKSGVYEGIEQLISADVLIPLSEGRRNRWWEAYGLLDLIEQLENGQLPS
jgi:hypothetical protein